MNNLKQLRDRLQTNYGDCHISYVPGQLTVKFGKGTILADGIRTQFQEDGQPVQEVTIANDDDLYEQMEAFLLYLKEGGAAAAQPESDKLRRNPTYRSASEALQKNGKRLLFALGTLEVLIFLSALFFGGSPLHYILFLLVPFLAMIPISWIQRSCISGNTGFVRIVKMHCQYPALDFPRRSSMSHTARVVKIIWKPKRSRNHMPSRRPTLSRDLILNKTSNPAHSLRKSRLSVQNPPQNLPPRFPQHFPRHAANGHAGFPDSCFFSILRSSYCFL